MGFFSLHFFSCFFFLSGVFWYTPLLQCLLMRDVWPTPKCVCVCVVCVSESTGHCQGQLEREFYQFNLKVREGVYTYVCVCVCGWGRGGGVQRRWKKKLFFPFMKINFYNLKAWSREEQWNSGWSGEEGGGEEWGPREKREREGHSSWKANMSEIWSQCREQQSLQTKNTVRKTLHFPPLLLQGKYELC